MIGFCLFLIDSQEVNINKLDSKKKINIHKIDKIFKVINKLFRHSIKLSVCKTENYAYINQICNFPCVWFQQLEVVPLFGDMMLGTFQYIEKTPNYDASKWPECNSEKTSPQAHLVKELPRIREKYVNYLSQLVDCRQRVHIALST